MDKNSPTLCGSSPPVRGTQLRGGLSCARAIPACAGNGAVCYRRFIPACAGNTPSVGIVRRAMCLIGSSPPVRGTLLHLVAAEHSHRFIPACAGNTPSAWRRSSVAIGSSPPVRGTHQQAHVLAGRAFAIGSSPPVRGTRAHHGTPPQPAYRAGSSPPVRGTHRQMGIGGSVPRPVHPRLCGEH